jgi:hypothetical protein
MSRWPRREALRGPVAQQAGHGAKLTGSQVGQLPPAARSLYEHACVHSLRPVFAIAAGLAAVGFLLSLLMRERKLRDTVATSVGLEDGLAAPRAADAADRGPRR